MDVKGNDAIIDYIVRIGKDAIRTELLNAAEKNLRSELHTIRVRCDEIKATVDRSFQRTSECMFSKYVHWRMEDRRLGVALRRILNQILGKYGVFALGFESVLAISIIRASGISWNRVVLSARSARDFMIVYKQLEFLKNHRKFIERTLDELAVVVPSLCIEAEEFASEMQTKKNRHDKEKAEVVVSATAEASPLLIKMSADEVLDAFDYQAVDVGTLYEDLEYEFQASQRRKTLSRKHGSVLLLAGNGAASSIALQAESIGLEDQYMSLFPSSASSELMHVLSGNAPSLPSEEQQNAVKNALWAVFNSVLLQIDFLVSEYESRLQSALIPLGFMCGADLAFECLACLPLLTDSYVSQTVRMVDCRRSCMLRRHLASLKVDINYKMSQVRKHLKLVQAARSKAFDAISVEDTVLRAAPSYSDLKSMMFLHIYDNRERKRLQRMQEEQQRLMNFLSSSSSSSSSPLSSIVLPGALDAGLSLLQSLAASKFSVNVGLPVAEDDVALGEDWVQSLMDGLSVLFANEVIQEVSHIAGKENAKIVCEFWKDDARRIHSAIQQFARLSEPWRSSMILKKWYRHLQTLQESSAF
eukprot:ANDGO_07610.mRNA.1 hypothetical protein